MASSSTVPKGWSRSVHSAASIPPAFFGSCLTAAQPNSTPIRLSATPFAIQPTVPSLATHGATPPAEVIGDELLPYALDDLADAHGQDRDPNRDHEHPAERNAHQPGRQSLLGLAGPRARPGSGGDPGRSEAEHEVDHRLARRSAAVLELVLGVRTRLAADGLEYLPENQREQPDGHHPEQDESERLLSELLQRTGAGSLAASPTAERHLGGDPGQDQVHDAVAHQPDADQNLITATAREFD